MDASFWLLALSVPALVVLLVLCIGCRDPEQDTPPIDDYQYKPQTCDRSPTFRVVRRPPSPPWSAIQPQPDLRRCPAQILATTPILMNEGDNESVPSYENEGDACDDGTGYIEVLPDPPPTDQGNGDCASSGSIAEPYENMPETESLQQSLESLGEYVNVLEPDATVSDMFLTCTSDRESEDDTPDYENVCSGV
ncbi:linker for activation of T-cells family member 1 isoform X2 [Tiliqua scincoides]|uniref:linker for activation of T-cells family member 1 isoform X2 n=1 Tax=Tiliqua scincoides TaxID=71010 RepID=UPI003461A4E9